MRYISWEGPGNRSAAFKDMSMLLAKNCYTKDNAQTCGTIKLGTLYEYRTIENPELADAGEGKFVFNLSLDGTVEIENRWFNTIFGGGVTLGGPAGLPNPNRRQVFIDRILQVASTPTTQILRDSKATIQHEAFNEFIFCMSLVEDFQSARGIFPHYDDCWFMDPEKAHEIADEYAKLLLLKIEDGRASGNHVVSPDISLEGLGVIFKHGLVEYVPREIHITNSSDMTVENFIKRTSDLNYVKPPSFSHEKEYRFSFTLFSKENKPIEPIVKFVILNVEHIT